MDLKVEGTMYRTVVTAATGEATPGKQRLTKNCSQWDFLAGQLVYLKVQQFRLETDHVPFSESKAFL